MPPWKVNRKIVTHIAAQILKLGVRAGKQLVARVIGKSPPALKGKVNNRLSRRGWRFEEHRPRD